MNNFLHSFSSAKTFFEPLVLITSLSVLHLLAFILTSFYRLFPLFTALGTPLLTISALPYTTDVVGNTGCTAPTHVPSKSPSLHQCAA